MKTASPKKLRGSIKRPGSPSKTGAGEDPVRDLQAENQGLHFQLGERDVEIERMKTTLFALNEKLCVVNDVKQDNEEHRQYLQVSEAERAKLQITIQETSTRILRTSETTSTKHKQLIDDIEGL